jgi:Fic family protein
MALKKPEFREDGDFVKVIFYFEKQISPKSTVFDIAKTMLMEHKVITTSHLIAKGVPRRTASAALKRLVDEGIALKIGDLRGSKYVVNTP